MIDLINRNEAIRRFDHMRELTADQVVEMLKRVPSCRHKGEWVSRSGCYGVAYCSECNYELRGNNTNFCPNCGSDNRETDMECDDDGYDDWDWYWYDDWESDRDRGREE